MTDKPKFTPGPWYVAGDDECPEGVPVLEILRGKLPSPECKQIAYVQPFEGDDDDFVITDETHANARLIASAPDLYEALILCLEWMGGKHDSAYVTSKAHAALSKAGGRS